MEPNSLKLWATGAYILVSLLFLLISLIISYRLVRRLIRISFASSLFGNSAKVRLITLAVAAIIFSDVLPALFIATVNVFTSLFIEGSRGLMDNWRGNIGFCERADAIFNCVGSLGMGFLQVVTNSIATAFNHLTTSIPIHKTLLLFATWALLSYVVTQAQQLEEATPGSLKIKSWLKSGYLHRDSPVVANVVFFLILAVGAYLSTAAIAAIPGLQEKSAVFQEVGPERLKSQLEESLSLLDKYSTEIGTTDPFAKLRAFTAKARGNEPKSATEKSETEVSATSGQNSQTTASTNPSPTPSPQVAGNSNTNANSAAGQANPDSPVPTAGAAGNAGAGANPIVPTPQPTPEPSPPSEMLLTNLELLMNYRSNDRNELIQTYKKLLADIKSAQKSAKNSAVQAYEVGNLDRKGNKERVQYFLALSEWFNRRAAFSDKELNGCLTSIQNLDNVWQTWADNVPNFFKASGNSYESIFSLSEGLSAPYTEARSACPISISLDPTPPERPQLGTSSYLGPFGFVASWLLRTESLPLALITGLLGFGLLGSACSTFVRERADKRSLRAIPVLTQQGIQRLYTFAPGRNGRLVNDLTGVIIRGLSAAVVVFLAVEGGLAIFASGGSEPNPYVLLLTCLIGAVFSERVWKWAKEHLSGTFGPKDDEPPNADGEEKPLDETVAEETASDQSASAGISDEDARPEGRYESEYVLEVLVADVENVIPDDESEERREEGLLENES